MGKCFACFIPSKSKIKGKKKNYKESPVSAFIVNPGFDSKKEKTAPNITPQTVGHTFTYRELVNATKNFREEFLLGEGGFGRVYKGCLESTGQVVAVKQLNRNGLQGNREFIVEVFMLNRLHHPNLVNLIGYCAEGDQRLLVYEFMPLRSLENHLHGVKPGKEPLDWSTRMKIAAGAAKGLEYLHDKATPSVIYRDLKSSNILLGNGYHPKLSDFGLAKLGPVGEKSHVSTRVMGTYGYCAPEYAMTGQLTLKSDVYSFGVLLLELITGRKAYTSSCAAGEQFLVNWAKPHFKDIRAFPRLADPLLEGRYPRRSLNHAVGIAARCLHEQPANRPLISEVANALSYLASIAYNHNAAASRSERVGPSSCLKNGDHLKSPKGGPRVQDEIEHGGRLIFGSPHQKNSPNFGHRRGVKRNGFEEGLA